MPMFSGQQAQRGVHAGQVASPSQRVISRPFEMFNHQIYPNIIYLIALPHKLISTVYFIPFLGVHHQGEKMAALQTPTNIVC